MFRADVAPASILKEKVGLASRKRIRPVWRHFLNREETVKRRTFDSSLYRSPNISPRASFRFRLGRNLIRISVADRLSQPSLGDQATTFPVFPARAGRPPTSEAGTERSGDRWCARSTPRVQHAREGISFRGKQPPSLTQRGETFRRFRIWKGAFVRRSTALLRQTS